MVKAFVKLDSNNVVTQRLVVDDKHAATEAKGEAFLRTILNDPTAVWKITGENPPYPKGDAGKGAIWDPVKEMFHTPQVYSSWTLNEDTGDWDPPTPRPVREDDGKEIRWNKDTEKWNIETAPKSGIFEPEA